MADLNKGKLLPANLSLDTKLALASNSKKIIQPDDTNNDDNSHPYSSIFNLPDTTGLRFHHKTNHAQPPALLPLSIPTNIPTSTLPSAQVCNSPPLSSASSTSSKYEASYFNDVTPLPSPLFPPEGDVFKAFNGRSPPNTTISRAPSLRGSSLRYGVDRSIPYKNIIHNKLNTSKSPPLRSGDDDDSDVLSDTTNLRNTCKRPKDARSVSEYVPVPSTTRTNYRSPERSPVKTPVLIPEDILNVAKQRSSGTLKLDDASSVEEEIEDELKQKAVPRSVSNGSPIAEKMQREQSATANEYKKFKDYNAQKGNFTKSDLKMPDLDEKSPLAPPTIKPEQIVPTLSTMASLEPPLPIDSPATHVGHPQRKDERNHLERFYHRHHPQRENEKETPERVFEAYDDEMHKSTWNEIKPLGTGAFSKVILGCPVDRKLKPEYQGRALDFKVAIKIVDIGNVEKHSRERMEGGLIREIEILKTIQHPSLIKMYAFNMDKRSALMVLPLCEGGDLFELISNHRKKIKVDLIKRIFGDVVRAISFLHENNVVHRDIKLESEFFFFFSLFWVFFFSFTANYLDVLLNVSVPEIFEIEDYAKYPKSLATVTDLGLCRKIDPEHPMLSTRCGSEDYVPPELLMGQEYDGRQTDSWAVGVLLYAMMEGRLPFDPPAHLSNKRGRGRIAHRIARVEWAWINFRDDESEEWKGGKRLVEGCLQRRDVRLLVKDIVQDDWIKAQVTDMEYPWPVEISSIFA
jgi:protein-serine/threonine kinase